MVIKADPLHEVDKKDHTTIQGTKDRTNAFKVKSDVDQVRGEVQFNGRLDRRTIKINIKNNNNINLA